MISNQGWVGTKELGLVILLLSLLRSTSLDCISEHEILTAQGVSEVNERCLNKRCC